MGQLYVLLILFAAEFLGVHALTSDNNDNDGEIGRTDNKTHSQGQNRWLQHDVGWSKKSKPFGRPGSSLFSTEDTVLDPTKVTANTPPSARNSDELTMKSATYLKYPNGLNDEEPTISKSISTNMSSFTTTKKTILAREDSRPVFATTSAPDTMSTRQTQPTDPIRQPFVISPREGGIVFPNDVEGTRPTPKPDPKSNPSGDVIEEKDPATRTSSTPRSKTLQDCIRNCPVTPEYNPVCGSDGITYNNPGRLFCSQSCGVRVNMIAKEPCRTTTVTPTLTTTLPPFSTTQLPAVQECIRKCPVTAEYNPVCGSDGVTYMNLGRLNCAYLCGISIRIESLGLCITSTTSSPARGTPSPTTRYCIRNCPVTSEYNPVCGSDGFTYTNPRRLVCAQRCGINVKQQSRGRCTDFQTTTSPSISRSTTSSKVKQCMLRCPVTTEYSPVCGSDGVTYNNADHLRCAQGCQVDVWQTKYGRCPKTFRQ